MNNTTNMNNTKKKYLYWEWRTIIILALGYGASPKAFVEVLSEARNFHEWSDSGRAEQPTANVVSRNANLFLS